MNTTNDSPPPPKPWQIRRHRYLATLAEDPDPACAAGHYCSRHCSRPPLHTGKHWCQSCAESWGDPL